MNKRIVIIGAGASGMVTAAWLLQHGHEVIVCDTEAQSKVDFAQIRENGLHVDGSGFATVSRRTNQMI